MYALESMSYMTAGLADVQKTDDIVVEAAMTKVFAAQAAREVVDHCSAILGIRSIKSEESFHEVFLTKICEGFKFKVPNLTVVLFSYSLTFAPLICGRAALTFCG